jgi:hypothetical protein
VDGALEHGGVGAGVVLGAAIALEQLGRDRVHPLVRALRGQDGGDQELERAAEGELDGCARIGGVEARQNLGGPADAGGVRLGRGRRRPAAEVSGLASRCFGAFGRLRPRLTHGVDRPAVRLLQAFGRLRPLRAFGHQPLLAFGPHRAEPR